MCIFLFLFFRVVIGVVGFKEKDYPMESERREIKIYSLNADRSRETRRLDKQERKKLKIHRIPG